MPKQKQNTAMRLTKRIGTTTYKVNVHFSETSKETIGDKIIRLIQSEADNVPHTTPIVGKREA